MKNPVSPELMRSEEEHKERVYKKFIQEIQDSKTAVERCSDAMSFGEDQDAFMACSALSSATKKKITLNAKLSALYKRPYFAHVAVRDEQMNRVMNCFLSDNESLDTSKIILEDGYSGVLLPFKLDSKLPISVAMFHCYQAGNGQPVQMRGGDGKIRQLTTELICDDEIDNRRLLSVTQKYPIPDAYIIDADEFLEQKLQDNRDNPTLRNIIATLQQKQFDIIGADYQTSFVVQGCAGSGKSQCLLHRLFFLRDQLSQDGWNHVLLLTPTQLFRNYSAELIRRYQLSDIHDCSLAELYRSMLNEYDSRFKNRQYVFELSEEYLPDEYLQEVYDPNTIEKINGEINRAICGYVREGCKALEILPPETIQEQTVEDLVKKLEHAVQAYDAREKVLQKDAEYISRRQDYEKSQKELTSARKNLEHCNHDHQKYLEEEKKLQELRDNLEDARRERMDWLQQRGQHIASEREKLNRLAKEIEQNFSIDLPAQYAQQLFAVAALTGGERARADKEYMEFLDAYCKEAEQELKAYIKDQTPEKVYRKLEKRKEELREKMEDLTKRVQQLTETVESDETWLRQRASEMEDQKTAAGIHRDAMEHSRYLLSRIESTVFEREVWNTLAPIKQKYQIQTLKVEAGKDGHQKESRILYKSDLLFYVKIYARLHPAAVLPDYRMLCIDEGQDLHKADYDLLHQLYPKAVFNVFGDTEQVLHTSCGIHNWSEETGIDTVYTLNRNYRNTAGIVDFCNTVLKSNMDYVGRVQTEQKPQVLRRDVELENTLNISGITIIVKNREMFAAFCKATGRKEEDFEYLDTHTRNAAGSRIPCYSIFAAKGLEFSSVLVYAKEMTKNQRVVACTRAMGRLYYYG